MLHVLSQFCQLMTEYNQRHCVRDINAMFVVQIYGTEKNTRDKGISCNFPVLVSMVSNMVRRC